MAPIAITHPDEATAAFVQLYVRMTQSSKRFDCHVGYHGGGDDAHMYWHESEGFWSLLRPIENRFWCCYGLEHPTHVRNLTITCEVNPPLEGRTWRCAGAFARDDKG